MAAAICSLLHMRGGGPSRVSKWAHALCIERRRSKLDVSYFMSLPGSNTWIRMIFWIVCLRLHLKFTPVTYLHYSPRYLIFTKTWKSQVPNSTHSLFMSNLGEIWKLSHFNPGRVVFSRLVNAAGKFCSSSEEKLAEWDGANGDARVRGSVAS